MKRTIISLIACSAAALLIVVATLAFHTEADVEISKLQDSIPADSAVFDTIVNVVDQYRATRPFAKSWKVDANRSDGIIQTNWYPEHLGEVTLKMQIAVRGTSFRVDVWHRIPLFGGIRKTEWARKVEWAIQSEIEKKLPPIQPSSASH